MNVEKPIDLIKIDNDGRCLSANCVYQEDDRVVQKIFENEEERNNFFLNISDYVYRDEEFIYEPKEEIEEPYEPTFEEIQNDINIDFDYRISLLELGI